MKIKTPATSANVGVGFDSFGMAFSLYNEFDVSLSDKDILENVEDRFNNENNLFLQSYHIGCDAIGISDYVHAIFHTNIPVSRGLGSSASLITAGLQAASSLHNNALSQKQIFELASSIEGHPDNVAPCIYGGMTISLKKDNEFITEKITLDKSWKYTIFVPNFEVSTEKARSILPDTYSREVVSKNIAYASYMIRALETGSLDLLQYGECDLIHEPYRKTLLPFFDSLKSKYKEETDGILIISGSGSTCLGISKKEVQKENYKDLDVHTVSICETGAEVTSEE